MFITAHGDENMRMQALRAGAVEFLAKPFDEEVLLDCVRAAMENRRAVAVQASFYRRCP